MTTTNLSEVPKEQLPRLIEDIIDEKAKVYFYMKAHSQYVFIRDDGRWPSQTGRYELKYPAQIVDELQRLYRGKGLGGISVPEILDEDKRTNYVCHTDDNGWSLDIEGEWQQSMNLVRFPYDQFQIEWSCADKETSRVRDSGFMAQAFLKDHPAGGKAELLRWLEDRDEVEEITENSVTWTDPAGNRYTKSLKTFLNLLSKYR